MKISSSCISALVLLMSLMIQAALADDHGQTKAILKRESIPDIPHAYTHPADVCQLRDGTLAIIYNGGIKEAEPGTRCGS